MQSKGVVMEKAFDVKALVEKIKAKGALHIAEEEVKVVVESVLEWCCESVSLSENKYDDFAVPVITAMKPFIMKELDKIDGKEG